MQRVRRLVIVGIESNWILQLVKGISAYCRFHGNWEFHTEGDSSPKSVRRTRQAIRQWKADGIIARIQSLEMERLIKDSGLPAVNVSSVRHFDLPTVTHDCLAIGKMGARYFLDNRFQNLAFCARTGEVFAQQRCDGFMQEAAKAGLNCEVFTDPGDDENEPEWVNNRRKLDPWLLSLKKPVGVMCMYDHRGQEMTGICRRLGLRVPDEVAILGTGNEESLCLMCNPPLSSVDCQNEQIGYEAARLMDRMLHGAKPPTKPILVPPRSVVVRQSSDIIAIDDRETVVAVRFIREHAYEPVTMKDVLEQVPLCRRALHERFTRYLGRTPKAELMRIRLLRAQNMLKNTDLSVKAVANGSGFVSYRVFTSFFRREMDMTPMQYRRSGSTPTRESSLHSNGTPYTNRGDSLRRPADSLRILSREQRQRFNELAASSRPYSRLKPSEMRGIILAICQKTFLTAAKLGELLHRNSDGLRNRFLTPMIDEGLLQRKYPDEMNHPNQAYTAKPQT